MKYLFPLVVLLVLTGSYSCKKKQPGCTTPLAINYNSDATVDDGTCMYESGIHFWIQENTWNGYGEDTLHVYTGGKKIGILSWTSSYLATPLCSNTGVLVYNYAYGINPSLPYQVKNGDGTTLWSNTISLSGEHCVMEQVH